MHGYGTSGNGKSETGSSNFPGMRFVHTVKTLKNPFYGFFRNSKAGIFNSYKEIFMIRIQCYTDPSFIYIIFNSILYQIADGKRKLHFVHICIDWTERIQDQGNTSLICNRPQTFQDIFQQFIDIHIGNIHICCLFVHFHKGEQICDNLVLSVNLFCNIRKEFLIQFLRNPLLSYKRVCQNFHGSHRCFQLMRHIGYKFLSGFIQGFHSGKHLIKCIRNQRCLCIIRNGDFFILISVCQIFDGFCYSGKRFHQNCGKDISQEYGQNYNNSNDQNSFLLQFPDG